MSAKHAVLGLVIEHPGYGYQLASRLEERCGAWGWEPSGVYGALNTLQREGHVQIVGGKESSDTGRAAPRVIYGATPAGVAFFRSWMMEASAPRPVRQELNLKLLFSQPEYVPRLIDQLSWSEQRCIDDLRSLTSAMQASVSGPVPAVRDVTVQLQMNAEIKLLQAGIEWLQDARKTMKQLLEEAPASELLDQPADNGRGEGA